MHQKTIWISGVICIGITGLITCILYWNASSTNIRNKIKKQCTTGMDCSCFANVIDYRFSDTDAKIFSRFLSALNKRPDANILEFTDEAIATRILTTVSVCRPKTESTNQPNKQKAQK